MNSNESKNRFYCAILGTVLLCTALAFVFRDNMGGFIITITILFTGFIFIDNYLDKKSLNLVVQEEEKKESADIYHNDTIALKGLNEETAKNIAAIIKNISKAPAVAITDKENVLAFIGLGCEKHPVGRPIVTDATRKALKTGMIQHVKSANEFGCNISNCKCPWQSAIIVPFFYQNQVAGALKLYNTNEGRMSQELTTFAYEISKLLSIQIEVAETERQIQLVTEAKLDALQAQINPHFLFNTLNTINMYIHNNPEFARKLIIRLSTYLRYMLGNNGRFITIGEEIKNIEDYLIIEKARFNDKLTSIIDVDEGLKKVMIPVLSIQPLVNNAIIHGILPKNKPCLLKVSAKRTDKEIIVSVVDNGIGVKKEHLSDILFGKSSSGLGVGLPNVNNRLKLLYGKEYGIQIRSIYGKGTKVLFKIPVGTGIGEDK